MAIKNQRCLILSICTWNVDADTVISLKHSLTRGYLISCNVQSHCENVHDTADTEDPVTSGVHNFGRKTRSLARSQNAVTRELQMAGSTALNDPLKVTLRVMACKAGKSPDNRSILVLKPARGVIWNQKQRVPVPTEIIYGESYIIHLSPPIMGNRTLSFVVEKKLKTWANEDVFQTTMRMISYSLHRILLTNQKPRDNITKLSLYFNL